MEAFDILGIAVILVVGGIIWKVVLILEKKRTEKFKLVAEQLGLPFYPSGTTCDEEVWRKERRVGV